MRLLQKPEHGDVPSSAMIVEVSSPSSEAARFQTLLCKAASIQQDKVGAPGLRCSQSLVTEASRKPQHLQ